MPIKRLLIVLFPLLATWCVQAQKSDDIYGYISQYKELAMQEMVRTGVPASIKLAQGIHETMAGKSDLVIKSNNHFGIKCKTSWTGDKVYHDDDARGECFRSYSNSSDSYMDHSNFLKNSTRYAFLFQLDPTDYKGWAYGLKKAGYATNIKYSQIIIKLIEDYNLQQYSLIALGRVAPQEEILAGNPVKPAQGESTLAGGPAVIAPFSAVEADVKSLPKVTYPEGEFTINNTKVVYVKSGTALLAVAQQYDVSLKRLIDFNDLPREEVLPQGQLMFLQRKRKVGASDKHIVQAGETLYDICQLEGIRFESLLDYNRLTAADLAAPGEALYLQEKAPARPRLASEVAPAPVVTAQAAPRTTDIATAAFTHTVQTKETLYSIARKYSITVEQLKEWNKMSGYEVKIGQALIIYKN
ncbi:glucosaminidase domain-containing protein [Paraflavitalea sp. CAU 1676]|uniref:glucosaminidase domain-containing protein n=1 Tax=Paraflavitalea sp. CAU 1676 TaxID=3032598 RepID=UPI0023DB1E04|nr:glucosaminidase domain-containing protein [Paraflavitalea sp. CAU 1676]MDF2187521.1 LysM peptidoglycan-binding domain-containing protein [Paraflavitalea sp. CAU 1676]